MSVFRFETAEDVQKNPDYKRALVSLLYQIADDNLLIGYRGSEWLGLAPHLEADVAFCSLAQDHMGHAALFYQLLEELGEGKADDLAHLREANSFYNARLAERANGSGDYITNPDYDWSYAVIRQYLFDVFEQIRMDALKHSSYVPLAQAAEKVFREKYYHVLHGESWLKQMAVSTDEARYKLLLAIDKTWKDLEDLFSCGVYAQDIYQYGLLESETVLRQRFFERMQASFAEVKVPWPGEPPAQQENGRLGEHTQELEEALRNLSEVYRQDPTAIW